MKALAVAFAFLVFLFAPVAQADVTPTNQVRIETGVLQGVRTPDAVVFKDIPYAAPPVGPLRWKPPQAPATWAGVRDASAFGAICPQTPNFATPKDAVQSEDCLSLNVWAPVNAAKPAPVMVWIHGGGDTNGTATEPQFDGTPFAKDGIVFVSVEYRLGALGWFAHPGLTREAGPKAPLANYGLMDQIAALKWVQRNIKAFGGDPRHVTVAGESAGGEAVLFLMTNPAARGLFAGAIVESGSGWAPYDGLAEQEKRGVAMMQKAGVGPSADAATLRALPLSAIMAATDGGGGAVVDGRLVKAAPAVVFAAHRSAPVPLLIGSNTGEDSLMGDMKPLDMLSQFTPDQLAALRKAYGAPEATDDTALAHAVFRDQWMGAPAHWIAGKQSAVAPTWLYHYAYVPQLIRGRMPKANHGVEMLFVFEAMARAPRPIRIMTKADTAEMSLVHGCWANFVKTGAPDCAAWPAYAPGSDQLLDFGDQAVVTSGFNKAAYGIYEGLVEAGLKAGR